MRHSQEENPKAWVRGRISRHLGRGGHLAPGMGEMARGERFPVSPMSLLAGTPPAEAGSSLTFSIFPKEELSCPQEVLPLVTTALN